MSLLLAVFKAVPTLETWYQRLMVEYVKLRKLQIAKENRQAITDALKDQDQRGLEDEEHSGKPSGVGTIRDSLPGVRND